MKKITVASQSLLWGVLFASACVSLASLILILIYAPVYAGGRMPGIEPRSFISI